MRGRGGPEIAGTKRHLILEIKAALVAEPPEPPTQIVAEPLVVHAAKERP